MLSNLSENWIANIPFVEMNSQISRASNVYPSLINEMRFIDSEKLSVESPFTPRGSSRQSKKYIHDHPRAAGYFSVLPVTVKWHISPYVPGINLWRWTIGVSVKQLQFNTIIWTSLRSSKGIHDALQKQVLDVNLYIAALQYKILTLFKSKIGLI